jgi:hypothetical protein
MYDQLNKLWRRYSIGIGVVIILCISIGMVIINHANLLLLKNIHENKCQMTDFVYRVNGQSYAMTGEKYYIYINSKYKLVAYRLYNHDEKGGVSHYIYDANNQFLDVLLYTDNSDFSTNEVIYSEIFDSRNVCAYIDKSKNSIIWKDNLDNFHPLMSDLYQLSATHLKVIDPILHPELIPCVKFLSKYNWDLFMRYADFLYYVKDKETVDRINRYARHHYTKQEYKYFQITNTDYMEDSSLCNQIQLKYKARMKH